MSEFLKAGPGPAADAGGNGEVCARTARLFAWVERQLVGLAASLEEHEGITVDLAHSVGRARLLDLGLRIETDIALARLRPREAFSVN